MRDAAGVVNWRGFLRALADEVDNLGGHVARDALLRSVGDRMGLLYPMPPVNDITSLQIEVNGTLADWGWGRAELSLDPASRMLRIVHHDLPNASSAGDPPGTWLSAVLEGLYGTWVGAMPGADRTLTARREAVTQVAVILLYGRH